MRCNICDKALTEAEIQYNPSDKSFECCTVCLDIALDAAYSNGFIKEDPLDDDELELDFGNGSIAVLDPEMFRSVYDHSDPYGKEDESYDRH
jgi:hypothetical protein